MRLDHFTRAYDKSRIAFVAAEVLTDGRGEMVDVACRYANAPAAALLGMAADGLKGRRYCRSCTAERLSALAPLSRVAFSGSAASFSYTTVLGRALRVNCYQLAYGVAGCVLDEPGRTAPAAGETAAARLLPGGTAVLELGRGAVRGLFFSPGLAGLTGWTQRELLNRFSADLSGLIAPEDWPELLQSLLDAVRGRQVVNRELRLARADGGTRWVDLRAERVPSEGGGAAFSAAVLDIDRRKRAQTALGEANARLESLRGQLLRLPELLPGGWLYRPGENGGAGSVSVGPELAAMLGVPAAELARHLQADPLWRVHPDDRGELTAAAQNTLDTGAPLRHTFRIQRRGSPAQWLRADGAAVADADGKPLLCGVCADVTPTHTLERTLRYHTALTELLLARPGAFALDYDPAADTARFERLDDGGQPTVQTLSDYRKNLPARETIHPNDRRAVLTAVRQAIARPGRGSCDFMLNWDGAFRRCHFTFLSLAEEGRVNRVIGTGEFIAPRRPEGPADGPGAPENRGRPE